MRSRPVLTALLVLALPLALARRPSAAAPPGPAQVAPSGGEAEGGPRFPALPALQKRKSRPVPLPGPERGPAALTAALSAGDMHDFFVGLMGKRAAELGRPAGRESGGPCPRCSPV
uniref:Tachykinin-3 n=1 Tax=Amazona collaria TaxID=241587 RepID=A0A8B9IUG3_9PSIT